MGERRPILRYDRQALDGSSARRRQRFEKACKPAFPGANGMIRRANAFLDFSSAMPVEMSPCGPAGRVKVRRDWRGIFQKYRLKGRANFSSRATKSPWLFAVRVPSP